MQTHPVSSRLGATDVTVSRTWPERRLGDRRVLDTRVDVDPTNVWLGDLDRRHQERRQFAKTPDRLPCMQAPAAVLDTRWAA